MRHGIDYPKRETSRVAAESKRISALIKEGKKIESVTSDISLEQIKNGDWSTLEGQIMFGLSVLHDRGIIPYPPLGCIFDTGRCEGEEFLNIHMSFGEGK